MSENEKLNKDLMAEFEKTPTWQNLKSFLKDRQAKTMSGFFADEITNTDELMCKYGIARGKILADKSFINRIESISREVKKDAENEKL